MKHIELSKLMSNEFIAFIKENGTKVSYQQLWNDVCYINSLIKNRNETVALIFKSKYLFTAALYATWINKNIVVPISVYEPNSNILKIKSVSGFNSILTDVKNLDVDLPIQTIETLNTTTKCNGTIDLASRAIIIFSSGSSGTPKGILLTHKNLYYSALGTNEFYGINATDSWPLTLPLNHIGGVVILIRSLLASSTVIEVASGKEGLSKSLKQYKPTTLSLIPTQLKRVLENSDIIPLLQTTKRIIIGGAKTPSWMIKKCEELEIPISISYGSSEMCAQISATTPKEKNIKKYSSGRLLPYRTLTTNNDKRIVVSGECLFLGYVKNGTTSTIGTSFITEDSGYVAGEEVFVTGRADNIFICGGENISPIEITDGITTVEGISSATVLPVQSEEFGQIPFAFIDNENIPFSYIHHKLSAILPHYKLPHYYEYSPKSKTLKMTKQLLTRNMNSLLNEGKSYIKPLGDPKNRAIILIHGFMGSTHEWDSITSKLIDNYYVLQVDLVGHGRSVRNGMSCTSFIHYINNLQKEIEHWCGPSTKPILFGYSMGGRVAMGLACHSPRFYKEIIIESANPGINDENEKKIRALHDLHLFDSIKNSTDFLIFLKSWYKQPIFGALSEETLNKMIASKSNFDFKSWKTVSHILSIGNQPSLWKKLTQITAKSTFISGEQDEKYSQIGKNLPSNFKHVIIKDIGHNTHISADFIKYIAF